MNAVRRQLTYLIKTVLGVRCGETPEWVEKVGALCGGILGDGPRGFNLGRNI